MIDRLLTYLLGPKCPCGARNTRTLILGPFTSAPRLVLRQCNVCSRTQVQR